MFLLFVPSYFLFVFLALFLSSFVFFIFIFFVYLSSLVLHYQLVVQVSRLLHLMKSCFFLEIQSLLYSWFELKRLRTNKLQFSCALPFHARLSSGLSMGTILVEIFCPAAPPQLSQKADSYHCVGLWSIR